MKEKYLGWTAAAIGVILLVFIFVDKSRVDPQPTHQPTKPTWENPAPPTRPNPPSRPTFPEVGKHYTYIGPWHTTNRKLDGIMTCEADCVAEGEWKGTFAGNWGGTHFSYDVEWGGAADQLKGNAKIDGANYTWTGKITPNSFEGDFTGSRYNGFFRLKAKN